MVWIGFLIVCPLLTLGCLSPVQVVGQGRLGEPIVCVGGLNEALGSGRDISLGFYVDDENYYIYNRVSRDFFFLKKEANLHRTSTS